MTPRRRCSRSTGGQGRGAAFLAVRHLRGHRLSRRHTRCLVHRELEAVERNPGPVRSSRSWLLSASTPPSRRPPRPDPYHLERSRELRSGNTPTSCAFFSLTYNYAVGHSLLVSKKVPIRDRGAAHPAGGRPPDAGQRGVHRIPLEGPDRIRNRGIPSSTGCVVTGQAP